MDGTVKYRLGYVWMVCLVAALGGLLFGYDWVVIGGAKPFFVSFFDLQSSWSKSWATSCALVGCLFGALGSGVLSERFGRKKLLIAAAVIFAVSSLGTGAAGHFQVFIAWRICGGLAIGLASSLSPMYIAEIAPAQMRGKLVAVNQFTIVIGILLAQSVNWLIAQNTPAEMLASWNVQMGWRWMFGVTAIPSLFFLAGMFFVPESPRWLAKNGSYDRAHAILEKVGGGAYATAALAEIRATLAQGTPRVDFKDLLGPKVMPILVLGIVLTVFQQWCGINVFFMYSTDILSKAGYSQITDILWNIVITGAVNLVFTIVAMGTVDRVGRRMLMLIGALGLTIIYLALGGCYYAMGRGQHLPGPVVLGLILAAIGCYAMTLAPVVWVIVAEIFPNRVRGTAMSLAVAALWIACFILTFFFLPLYEQIGPAYTFWMFAGICLLGFVYLLWRLPETKGKSLEQLERDLVD